MPPTTSPVSALAAAFSRPVYRGLAAPGSLSREVAGRLRRIAAAAPDPSESLAEAFDAALSQLRRDYRCEYYFKSQVVSKVVFGRHSPRTASALLELPVGAAVGDVVVVNGTTTVYELKTDLDNFDRLAGQLEQYRTRMEHVHLVVSDRRAVVAERSCPGWVGITAVGRRGSLREVRPSRSQAEHLLPLDLFGMLRTEEARAGLADVSGELVYGPTGAVWPVLRDRFAALPPEVAHAAVVKQLRQRGTRVVDVVSRSDFPQSLRVLAYAQPLSARAQTRLQDSLLVPAAAYL